METGRQDSSGWIRSDPFQICGCNIVPLTCITATFHTLRYIGSLGDVMFSDDLAYRSLPFWHGVHADFGLSGTFSAPCHMDG